MIRTLAKPNKAEAFLTTGNNDNFKRCVWIHQNLISPNHQKRYGVPQNKKSHYARYLFFTSFSAPILYDPIPKVLLWLKQKKRFPSILPEYSQPDSDSK